MNITRVLVVDDSAFIRDVIKMALASASGAQIELCAEASSAQELWQALESCDMDVVTLDIELPDANGLELIELVKARANCGVVVISGTPNQHDLAMQLGAAACFEKSELLYDSVRFAQAIRDAAGHGDREVA
ncbi:hypothetical protein BH10PSE12_BH10PSE12_10700 [soil metagenome]